MGNYIHNLDPFAIHFWGDLGIRWYGLAYLAGFVIGYFYMVELSKRGSGIALKPPQIADFITWVAIGTLAGGRIGYAVFYAPELLFEFSGSFPFWGVLEVHKGGMASHGGILGIVIACVAYARVNKAPILHLVDLTCVGGALGIFFGRMANFINGELYGRQAPEGLVWAVKFPQEMYLWASQNVSQLYKIEPAVLALGKVEVEKPQFSFFTELKLRMGEIFSGSPYPSGRFVELTSEQWRQWVSRYKYDGTAHASVNRVIDSLVEATQAGNQVVTEALSAILTSRHPSQLYQGLLEGLFVCVALFVIWLKPRRPGMIAVAFGSIYLIARIIGEIFRMPDAHIGFEALGLTRGQWISIGGFSVVAIVWYFSKKIDLPKMGGWGRTESTEE